MGYRMQHGWGSQVIADIDERARQALEDHQVTKASEAYQRLGVLANMNSKQLERFATQVFLKPAKQRADFKKARRRRMRRVTSSQ